MYDQREPTTATENNNGFPHDIDTTASSLPHFNNNNTQNQILINNPNSMEFHLENPNNLCNFTNTTTTTTDMMGFGSSSSISLGKSSLGFPAHYPSGSGPYDPVFHLNLLPPQPSDPLFRDLMFHGYGGNFIQSRGDLNGNSSSLFGGFDEGNTIINGVSGLYQDNNGENNHMQFNGVFEFTTSATACLGEGKEGMCPKNFVTERERRKNFNDKYQHLRSLVPSPTKGDRASIVGDAISYINELKRTVSELKLLVEKKRVSSERVRRLMKKTTNDGEDNGSGRVVKPDPDDEVFNGSSSAATQLRSSWLKRKCKDTEVDVRIVDDEVTIKLVQRKKMNCLLSVSRTLDELQLDLRHVAGGHVGDYYSYLFNTKIGEGSSVYASAIANKLIEVVERQYTAASVAVLPTTSF